MKTLPHLLKPDLDLGLLNSQPRMEHVASGKNDLKHEQGSDRIALTLETPEKST